MHFVGRGKQLAVWAAGLLLPVLVFFFPGAAVSQTQDENEEELWYRAEQARFDDRAQTVSLNVNVEIRHRQTVVRADQAVLNEKDKTITALGNVEVEDREFLRNCPQGPDGAPESGCENRIFGEYLYFHYEDEYFEIREVRGVTYLQPDDKTGASRQAVARPDQSNPNPNLTPGEAGFNPDDPFGDAGRQTPSNPPSAREPGSVSAPSRSQPLFYSGREAYGTTKKITLLQGEVTTCEESCSREYRVTGKKFTIYPNIKVIARKAVYFIGGQRTLYFPVYVISLKERDESNLPEYGYNDVVGFYVKAKYAAVAREAAASLVLFNYFQKKGIGFGVEHKYDSGRFGGPGRIYAMRQKDKSPGSRSAARYNDNFELQQKVEFNSNANLNLDYRKVQNFTSIIDKTDTTTLGYTYSRTVYSEPEGQGRTAKSTLSLKESVSKKKHTTSPSTNASFGLQFGRTFSKDLSVNTSWSQTESLTARQVGARNREGDLKLNPQWKTRYAILSAIYSRHYDLDGDSFPGDINNQAFQRPEIQATADRKALEKADVLKKIATLSVVKFTYGRYQRGLKADERQRRSKYETSWTRSIPLSGSAGLTLNQDYIQNLYQSGDRQYVMRHSTQLKKNFTPQLNWTATFRSTKDNGGLPDQGTATGLFAGDRGAETSGVQTSLNLSKKRTSFTATFGKNYKTNRYDPLNLKYRKGLSQWSDLDLSSSFDFNQDRWSPMQARMLLYRKNTILNLGANYNLDQQKMTDLTATAEISRMNGWKMRVLSQYQPRSVDPFIRQIQATKTNCCTEVQMAWRVRPNEFVVSYSVLAFPRKKVGFISGDAGLQFDQNLFQESFSGGSEEIR